MKNTRNYGIDCLRILSMLMICTQHIIIHGLCSTIPFLSEQKFISLSILYSACFCAVDCFALISGFVCVKQSQRKGKILTLWLEVLFYSLAITLCFQLLNPIAVSKALWLKAFFPIFQGQYWYFTAYMGLLVVLPLLNTIVIHTDKNQLKRCLLIGIIVFSIISSFPRLTYFQSSIFHSGYNGVWLAWLYLIGGFCSRYGFSQLLPFDYRNITLLHKLTPKTLALLGYLCSLAIITITPYLSKYFSIKYIARESIFGIHSYVNIFVVLSALSLLFVFSKMSFSQTSITIIRFFSPLTFGVYLLHDHPLIRTHIMPYFRQFNRLDSINLLFFAIGVSVCLYIVLSLFDWIRFQLFHIVCKTVAGERKEMCAK